MKATRIDKGETLTETLVALLIGSLAIIMLVTSVVGAAHINQRSQASTENLWGDPSETADSSKEGELTAAERGDGYVGTDGNLGDRRTGEITIKNDTYDSNKNHQVVFSGGSQIVSYELKGSN